MKEYSISLRGSTWLPNNVNDRHIFGIRTNNGTERRKFADTKCHHQFPHTIDSSIPAAAYHGSISVLVNTPVDGSSKCQWWRRYDFACIQFITFAHRIETTFSYIIHCHQIIIAYCERRKPGLRCKHFKHQSCANLREEK